MEPGESGEDKDKNQKDVTAEHSDAPETPRRLPSFQHMNFSPLPVAQSEMTPSGKIAKSQGQGQGNGKAHAKRKEDKEADGDIITISDGDGADSDCLDITPCSPAPTNPMHRSPPSIETAFSPRSVASLERRQRLLNAEWNAKY